MADPRIEQYARLLVERSIDPQPGWQVLIVSAPAARPLVEEVVRLLARRGAYALPRIFPSRMGPVEQPVWAREAPLERLGELPDIERHAYETADAYIAILAPENLREVANLAPERFALLSKARTPLTSRTIREDIRWVGCYYPTPAAAQEAGMSTREFEQFLYGACLLDWDAEERRMRRVAEPFDRASEVRIVAEGTDLRIGVEGRSFHVDVPGANVPAGEFFTSPVEESAEGVISFSEYPALYGGAQLVEGVRLRFEAGVVVDASAETNERFLLSVLETDEGARRLGELGIGCNPGIQRHMRNTLFDEKIDGTVHLAIGAGFPFLGGTNESAIHWDMVKDLRRGGEIHCDGEVVQRDGRWLF